jgi:hypothetical protein
LRRHYGQRRLFALDAQTDRFIISDKSIVVDTLLSVIVEKNSLGNESNLSGVAQLSAR